MPRSWIEFDFLKSIVCLTFLQDLATGLDIEGEPIKEPMHSIMPLLLDQQMSNYDKMRIIILYIISKNGVSEENLNKVIRHGQLSPEEKQAIINLSHIGLNAVLSVSIFAVPTECLTRFGITPVHL